MKAANPTKSISESHTGADRAGIFIGVILGTAIGFLTLFSHMFPDGFSFVPGDFGDSRLVNLLLEHNYSYFFQWNGGSFWSPEWMFYPMPDGLALSEVMTGSSWIYAIFRALSYDYQTSFQLWILSCAALNFLTATLLFRTVGLSTIAALAGAWVFAFAMPRAGFLIHPQLMPGFYSPLAFLMLWKYAHTSSGWQEFRYLAFFAVFAALQIWSCIYLGWFLGFFVGVGVIIFLINRPMRSRLLRKLKNSWKPVLGSGILFGIMIAPVGYKLMQTGAKYGNRGWMDVSMYLPEFYLFLLPHEDSLLYGWLFDLTPHSVKYLYEKLVFPGFVVFVAPFVLLRLYRKNSELLQERLKLERVLLWLAPVLVIVMFLLTLKIKNTESLWRLPYSLFPGAKGLRTAGRIILLTLLPMGFSFGVLLDYARANLKKTTGIALTMILTTFVILENTVVQSYAFKKSGHTEKISPLVSWLEQHRESCDAFYYYSNSPTAVTQIDGMWASFLTKIPTLNAHSGVSPKDYKSAGLDDAVLTPEVKAEDWVSTYTDRQVRICHLDKDVLSPGS